MTGVTGEELALLEVCAGIPARDLAALAASLKPMHAVAGSVLMRQGEPGLSFVIIASGRVEIRHVGPSGQIGFGTAQRVDQSGSSSWASTPSTYEAF